MGIYCSYLARANAISSYQRRMPIDWLNEGREGEGVEGRGGDEPMCVSDAGRPPPSPPLRPIPGLDRSYSPPRLGTVSKSGPGHGQEHRTGTELGRGDGGERGRGRGGGVGEEKRGSLKPESVE